MTNASAAQSATGFFVTGAERTPEPWTAKLGRAWAHHRAYRATLAELRGLSGRGLRDIGVRRSALKQVAFEAAQAS